VQETGSISVDVYRSPLIPAINTNALSVQAASLGLPATVGTRIATGSYEPVAVLGAAAAQRLDPPRAGQLRAQAGAVDVVEQRPS